jgi:hypothetical protein
VPTLGERTIDIRYVYSLTLLVSATSAIGCDTGPLDEQAELATNEQTTRPVAPTPQQKPADGQDTCDKECQAQKAKDAQVKRDYLAAKYPRERARASIMVRP